MEPLHYNRVAFVPSYFITTFWAVFMLSSQSKYCFKVLREVLFPVLVGLLVFTCWASAQGAKTDGDVSQYQLSFASVDNPWVSSLVTLSGDQISAKISAENLFGDLRVLFLWGITNDTMSEDDRIYPHCFSYSSACHYSAESSYQSGRISSPFDTVADLSLIILATVVFLN